MLWKCEDIRNEGIEGVLPITGSTPSSTARHHVRRRGRATMLDARAAEHLRQRPCDQDLIPSPTHQWRLPRVRDITMKDSPLHSNQLGSGRISPGNQGQESRDSSIHSGTGVTRSSRSPRAQQGPPSRWLHTARCTGEADTPPPAHGPSTAASCSALQMLTHGRGTADLLLRA